MIQENHSTELTPGTLCWARRPISKNIDSIQTNTSQQTTNNDTISETIWWPSLIYPSWSEAASHGSLMKSTLVTSSSKKRKITNGVLIVGIRDAISIQNLENNMVPRKVALRYNKNETKKRVVAHYLGLQNLIEKQKDIPSWTAVTQDEVILYSKNVLNILFMYKGKIHRHDWQSLLHAMKEASIVTEKSSLDPDNLLFELAREMKRATKEDGETTQDNTNTQTPEFFDDWKTLSRGSQSQSQSRLTQFSQVKTQSQLCDVDLDKKLVALQEGVDALINNRVEGTGVGYTNNLTTNKNTIDDEDSVVMKKAGSKAVQFVDDQVSCSTSSHSKSSNDDSKSVETSETEALVSDEVLCTQPC